MVDSGTKRKWAETSIVSISSYRNGCVKWVGVWNDKTLFIISFIFADYRVKIFLQKYR